ncbi:hypothetical protein AC1031_012230 [Aphanomyces cochlioides]|nr:hypothetical protein AC1031_012230 [Aphanomyces cochlioides]
MSLYVLSEGLTLFGLLSGAYQSLKALRRQERHSDCHKVLKFWTVLGSIILFEQYVEGFIAWLPFYYWIKCSVVGALLLPKAQLHVVAFESIVLPLIDHVDAYYRDTTKPELLRLGGMYGQWLHQAVMQIALPTLSDTELDKLERDLKQRLADIEVNPPGLTDLSPMSLGRKKSERG